MRAFIGIKPSNETLRRISLLMQNFHKNKFIGNYTDINNIHITLNFLGEIRDDQVDIVKNIIEERKNRTFEITIKRIKTLKDMIILEIALTDELLVLQKDLEEELMDKGFKLEKRRYYPHITLIRETNLVIDKPIEINNKVDAIELFSSERKFGKIIYIEKYKKNLEVKFNE